MCTKIQFSSVFAEALFTTAKNRYREENAQAEFQRQRPLKDHYSADVKIKTGNKFSATL